MTEENMNSSGTHQDEILSHVKGVIEAILFVNERPVTLDEIKKVLPTVTGAEIKKALKTLMEEHVLRESGVQIVEIAGGYQMLSNRKYAEYIRLFYKKRHKEKLSKPALETLAIVAYKQPVTRGDIELIRGVNSDGVMSHLIEKELIKVVGRKDIPGRPFLHGTTKQFLEYFGLKSLEDLPKLEEFPMLQERAEGVDEYDDLDDEERIPEDEIPMNSLEAMKQSAIKEAPDTESSSESADLSSEEIEETSEELERREA
ncbi:MAG: SMC-Scp complex subunit ScpB [Candidatus Omnitrophica bacterium]|nr:SMC-Scp complex subunit ScpB [Candidatus Omnitrophota bacterium]